MPLAKAALQQIEVLRVPADPINFELFYVYAAGYNQRLNQAINQILDQNGKLTESDLDRLHAEHLSSRRSVIQLDKVAQRLSSEIAQVVQNLDEASTSSKSYRQELDVSVRGLDGDLPFDKLTSVVDALVSATIKIEERNHSFEERLEESKATTEQLQLNVEKIRRDISLDSLTQLGNRRYLDETLTRTVSQSRETGSALTLLMADIDNFKHFNDTFGHPIGDEVLRLVAGNIKSALRQNDVACRYGGEEFVVILPNVDVVRGQMVAERIREAVSSKQLKKRSTDQVIGQVTISVGVVQLRDHESEAEFIERADECMYAAKQAGRNRVICETAASAASAA
jgi:diguanylate cyclase